MPIPGDYEDEPQGPSAGNAPSGGGWSPPTPGSSSRTMTSAWGRSFYDRDTIRQTYYTDPSSGSYVPLRERLFTWRSQYQQMGNADLDGVLDYYLAWDRTPANRYGGRNIAEGNAAPRSGQRTVAHWLNAFREMDEDKLRGVQKQMFEAGFYSPEVYKNPDRIRWGSYDPFTQEAASLLLKDGVMEGDMPLSELLRKRKEEIEEAGGLDAWMQINGAEGPERAPFSAVVTNPLDIQKAGQDISVDLTGRRIDGAVNPAEYQGLEVGAQRADYDSMEAGGTSTQAPSLGAFAENEIRQNHGAEVGAYEYLGNYNALLQRVGLAG